MGEGGGGTALLVEILDIYRNLKHITQYNGLKLKVRGEVKGESMPGVDNKKREGGEFRREGMIINRSN